MTEERRIWRQMGKKDFPAPVVYLLPVKQKELQQMEGAWLDLLPPDSRAAILKIRNREARVLSLAGELLVRRTAAFFLDGGAFHWAYKRGAKGKPFFPQAPCFHFNVSHTTGLAAISLAGEPVGVDVEFLCSSAPLKAMRRVMTPWEQEEILRLPEGETQARLFFEIWTRKEAYGKWTGEGLTAAMKTLEVTTPPLQEQIRTLFWQDWVCSVCATPGTAFEIKEVPFWDFLTGDWEPE